MLPRDSFSGRTLEAELAREPAGVDDQSGASATGGGGAGRDRTCDRGIMSPLL